MRTPALLAAILAVGVAAPVGAQVSSGRAEARSQPRPDVVVARLMSFDRDGDGKVSRAELPERMQALVARFDASSDEGLDAREVLRIAQQPRVAEVRSGLEPGHYGFAEDIGFDTRLHIDGAIDDLRLAGRRRQDAIAVAHTFLDTSVVQARSRLLRTATSSLTVEQFSAFKALLDRPLVEGVLSTIVSEGGPELKSVVARAQAVRTHAALVSLVSRFPLDASAKRRMRAALEQFKPHSGLNDVERVQLLNQMRGVLTVQQRDDLRSALERRPIVKQDEFSGSPVTLTLSGVANGPSIVRANF